MSRRYVQVRRPVHGTGVAKIPAPVTYRGGVFGGPILPADRHGVFATHWALDPRWTDDAGSLAPFTNKVVPGTTMYGNAPMLNAGGSVDGLSGWWGDRSAGERTWIIGGAAALAAFLWLRK